VRRPTGLFALPLVALVTILASSCADQAEGERCDPRNNNQDCESGLVCVQLSSLDPAETDDSIGICCPENSEQASDVCSSSSYTPKPDGGTPGSGGTPGAGGASAGGASAGGASAGGASAGGADAGAGGASAGGASAGGADAGAGGASAGGASTGGASGTGGSDAGTTPDASGD